MRNKNDALKLKEAIKTISTVCLYTKKCSDCPLHPPRYDPAEMFFCPLKQDDPMNWNENWIDVDSRSIKE